MCTCGDRSSVAVALFVTTSNRRFPTSRILPSSIRCRLYVSGEDTLDDYPLAVFCPYVSNPNDEQMARMIRVSREESEVPRRRYHPEDPERRARRILREQQRKQRDRERKEKKERRRALDRLKRERTKLMKENEKRRAMGMEELDVDKMMEEKEAQLGVKEETAETVAVKEENDVGKEENGDPNEESMHGNEDNAVTVKEENAAIPDEANAATPDEANAATPDEANAATNPAIQDSLIPSAPMSASTDADCVVMASSVNKLHIWVLPKMEQIKKQCQSIVFDLAPEVPNLEIQDVAFLDGFDRKGTTAAVAAKGGLVLVVDLLNQKVLHKVRAMESADL